MKKLLTGFLLITLTAICYANNDSPYKGQEFRDIKALSKQDIDGYLSGKGMGYAKAAELNHYPGPRHVLDLAQKLALSEKQRTRTQELFNTMKAEAIVVGTQLVGKEKQLDELFASGNINQTKLDEVLHQIGILQARLRYIHLKTHLQQKKLLTQQQIENYDRLRGYTSGQHGHQHNHTH